MSQTLTTRINGQRVTIAYNGNEYVGHFAHDGNVMSLPYELRSTYYATQLASIIVACIGATNELG